MKKTSGITLIALVVTIIVLIILATISINAVIGDNGLIKKAEQSKETHIEAQAKEKLSLKLAEYKVEIYEQGIKDATLRDSYLCTKLSELGPTQEIDAQYYEVEVYEWLFWVDRETLEIVSKGKSTPILPEKIEMKEPIIEMYIGEGKTIGLTLTPTNTSIRFLKWTSSDETIAKINNGVATGVAEGTATITVESTEDASIKATCTLTVKPVELTGISLNKTETTIYTNKTETLEVTYEPVNATYKDVTWDSSDKTVATVDNNGVVTGLKSGTTTITVASTKSIKAECTVTVEDVIEINTVEELKAFRDDVNNGKNNYVDKKVILMNDLELNQDKYTVADNGTVTFDSDAEQWTAIGTKANKFSGSFDGQGHTISGLYINKPDEMYQGFFGNISGNKKSSISNLILKDVYIYGANYTGGIVGKVSDCTIKNCGVTGNIVCTAPNIYTNGGGYVAGMVGMITGTSNIENCYNGASVTAEGNYQVGGICGEANAYVIKNCYNYGIIKGKNQVGGIIGSTLSRFYNCYNLANIYGNDEVGGAVRT